MKKSLLISLASLLAFGSVSGQAFSFVVERNSLFFEDGSVAGRDDGSTDNRDLITVWGTSVSSGELGSFSSAIEAYTTSADVSDLNTALTSLTWTQLTEAAGLFSNTQDFRLSANPATPGDAPIMLVTTSTDFNNVAIGDQVGLVSSSTLADELGTASIGFSSGTGQWDNAIVGNLGSLQLVSVVPEPSAFALLSGILVLGWVAVRRRA